MSNIIKTERGGCHSLSLKHLLYLTYLSHSMVYRKGFNISDVRYKSPNVKKYIYKSLTYNLSKDFLHLILSIDFLTFNLVSVFTSDADCVRNLHQSSMYIMIMY